MNDLKKGTIADPEFLDDLQRHNERERCCKLAAAYNKMSAEQQKDIDAQIGTTLVLVEVTQSYLVEVAAETSFEAEYLVNDYLDANGVDDVLALRNEFSDCWSEGESWETHSAVVYERLYLQQTPMTFDEAVECYRKYQEEHGNLFEQPSEGHSELRLTWNLCNVNGMLATVDPENGSVMTAADVDRMIDEHTSV